ncbi:hypothetical protein EKO04_001102 [Ascochyta lentis]|uniref:Uncharacterized protein n=1 Tax=Ascochyta lentis TaxID=205686 RepID=A0A8H7JDX5_9PLEO|nr:hypothetical protein EKO04_001102 [Ascochyta lentis]
MSDRRVHGKTLGRGRNSAWKEEEEEEEGVRRYLVEGEATYRCQCLNEGMQRVQSSLWWWCGQSVCLCVWQSGSLALWQSGSLAVWRVWRRDVVLVGGAAGFSAALDSRQAAAKGLSETGEPRTPRSTVRSRMGSFARTACPYNVSALSRPTPVAAWILDPRAHDDVAARRDGASLQQRAAPARGGGGSLLRQERVCCSAAGQIQMLRCVESARCALAVARNGWWTCLEGGASQQNAATSRCSHAIYARFGPGGSSSNQQPATSGQQAAGQDAVVRRALPAWAEKQQSREEARRAFRARRAQTPPRRTLTGLMGGGWGLADAAWRTAWQGQGLQPSPTPALHTRTQASCDLRPATCEPAPRLHLQPPDDKTQLPHDSTRTTAQRHSRSTQALPVCHAVCCHAAMLLCWPISPACRLSTA